LGFQTHHHLIKLCVLQLLTLAPPTTKQSNHQAQANKQTNKQTIKENNSDDTCFGLQAFALKKVRSLSL